MPFDLRTEAWLPLRRLDGTVEWSSPAAITDRIEANPFVEVASPRPDFDGAITELLIGMLAVALQPKDEDDWLHYWMNPPTPQALAAALAALPAAFDLLSSGPAFLQDFATAELADVEPARIEQILLDAPGDQTAKLNKDLFVKRDMVGQLGRPAAAMALLTLQTYAPGGGQGHRVGVRGGGPLTTLVDPRPAETETVPPASLALWRLLWANVPTTEFCQPNTNGGRGGQQPHMRFPWLAPTRVSDKGGRPTLPADADPLQAFFGMPRRIRLQSTEEECICALTGRVDAVKVSTFQMRNFGVQYVGWQHPLTPMYHVPKTGEWLPIHGQPGGINWRDWPGVVLKAPNGEKRPASMVAHFLSERGRAIGMNTARLRIFGYDFDKMKARAWISGTLPAFVTTDERQERLAFMAGTFVEATSLMASLLRTAVRRTHFGEREPNGDGPNVTAELWDQLEEEFYAALRRLLDDDVAVSVQVQQSERFLQALRRTALGIFDAHCSLGAPNPMTVRRAIENRTWLSGTLHGYGKMGQQLWSVLRLAAPESAKSKKARTKPATRAKS